MSTFCYWNLCDCPTPPPDAPCTEHRGLDCSIWHGQIVTTETQINDSLTAELQTAIAEADADIAQLDIYQSRAEQLKADAEREQRDAENAVNGANSYSARKQAVAEVEEGVNRSKARRDEFRQLTDDTSGIGEKYVPAIDRGFNRLLIPYSDPNGYCACYQRKVNRLATLATRIATDQTTLTSLQTTTLPTAKSRVLASLLTLVFPVFTGLFLGVQLLLAYLGLISLGTLVPIAAALALFAAMVIIAASVLYLLYVTRQIVNTRKRLLQLILMYYRIQQISTCRKVESEEDEDGEEDGSEQDGRDSGTGDDSEWLRRLAEMLEQG